MVLVRQVPRLLLAMAIGTEQTSTSVSGIEELRGAVGRVKHGKAGMQGLYLETSGNMKNPASLVQHLVQDLV